MKTVLLSPELFLAEGGIARIMRLYLKALCDIAAAGDHVASIVLNDAPADDPRLARFSTAALQGNTGCSRSKWHFLRATLKAAWRADRLVCGHLHQLPVAWLAKRFNPRLDYYLVAHGIDVWRPYSLLERLALRNARRILCISDYTRRQMLRFCPSLEPARLVVVPNTMDPEFVPAELPAAPVRNLQGPRILCVARLATTDTYKGVDTLIESLPLVRRRLPLAHLCIVGGGDDLPRLRDLARRLGVEVACTFTGIIDDDALRNEYATCDIFALPSRKEGFGLVYIEAMSHGKPCLGSHAGGVPEVIDDAVGTLAAYGNIPEIAAGLIDLAQHLRDPHTVRAHADTFAYPCFRQKLDLALR